MLNEPMVLAQYAPDCLDRHGFSKGELGKLGGGMSMLTDLGAHLGKRNHRRMEFELWLSPCGVRQCKYCLGFRRVNLFG